MADDHGRSDLGVAVGVRFQIRPADRAGIDLDANLVVATGRVGNRFDADVPGAAIDDCFHRVAPRMGIWVGSYAGKGETNPRFGP